MPELHTMIETHLNQLELQPSLLSVSPQIPTGWSFLLAPGISSELYLFSPEESHAQLLLVTTIDLPFHPEMDILGATLTSAITPLSLTTTPGQMALRLVMTSHNDLLPHVLNESVILTRHVAGAVFTAALTLCKNEYSLTESIHLAMEQLKQARIPT